MYPPAKLQQRFRMTSEAERGDEVEVVRGRCARPAQDMRLQFRLFVLWWADSWDWCTVHCSLPGDVPSQRNKQHSSPFPRHFSSI